MRALLAVFGGVSILGGMFGAIDGGAMVFAGGLIAGLFFFFGAWICERLTAIEGYAKRMAETVEREQPSQRTTTQLYGRAK